MQTGSAASKCDSKTRSTLSSLLANEDRYWFTVVPVDRIFSVDSGWLIILLRSAPIFIAYQAPYRGQLNAIAMAFTFTSVAQRT